MPGAVPMLGVRTGEDGLMRFLYFLSSGGKSRLNQKLRMLRTGAGILSEVQEGFVEEMTFEEIKKKRRR